jgi:hypothetical protein
MPRIRTIKPEFWSDYRMSRMPTLDRLVFIALWSMADDAGRIEGDADTVWRFANLREEPREAVEGALQRLASDGRITCYRTMGDDEGTPYIAVVHWRQHQRIDHPTPSKLPPPPGTCDDDGIPREDSRAIRERSRPRGRPRGSGIRDQGRERNTAAATHAGACEAAANPAAAAADFSPTPKTEDPDPIADALARHFPGRSSWLPAARRLAEARGVEKATRAIAEAARAREPVKSFRYVESIAEAQAATNGRPSAAASVEPNGITPELIEQKRLITEQVRRMAAGIGRRA